VNRVRPGDVIAGKFRVERVLGEGGMGFVVAAKHLQLGQRVALKFLHARAATPETRTRFLREARNTARLKSRHVARVLDVGTADDGTPFMVMEYLEGTDLLALATKQKHIAPEQACEFVIQACEAISEAHALGIVHRDLKPANLFLTTGQSGETVVKVIDFGVSKALHDAGGSLTPEPDFHPLWKTNTLVTKATDLLGSPSYMAPEQFVSAASADARSDIWSLGVILYRLVSGELPFDGSSLAALMRSILTDPIPRLSEAFPSAPRGIDDAVARCLVREPDDRLASVQELAKLLAPFASGTALPSVERAALLGETPSMAPRSIPRSLPPPPPPPSRRLPAPPPLRAITPLPRSSRARPLSEPVASGQSRTAPTRVVSRRRRGVKALDRGVARSLHIDLRGRGGLVVLAVFLLFVGVAAVGSAWLAAKILASRHRDAGRGRATTSTPADDAPPTEATVRAPGGNTEAKSSRGLTVPPSGRDHDNGKPPGIEPGADR